MIICATGHRPDKLGGYGPMAFDKLVRCAESYLTAVRPSEVISGMALGWDQAFAQAAISMGIPVHAAVPFDGQERMWPMHGQDVWRRLIAQCASVTIVSPIGYSPFAMQQRNEWMVDRAHRVCAMWDGSPGGTNNCVKYAKRLKREIDNQYTIWQGM